MSPSDPSPRESFPLIIDLPNEDLAIEISDAFDQIVAAPLAMHDESSSTVFDTSVGRPLKMDLPRGVMSAGHRCGGKIIISKSL